MIKTNQRDIGERLVLLAALVAIAILFPPEIGVSATTLSAGLHTDIEYGRAGEESLLLDAFVPNDEGVHPVVIIVHGGGWGSGDKQDMNFLFEPLSRAGFTWFAINYRLAPKHRWPGCLEDVQTAVRWVKSHASEYRGDPQKIVLIGYSAGGHLVCLAAVEANEDTSVQAVVAFAAPTDQVADTARRGGLSSSLQQLFDRPKEVDDVALAILRQTSPLNYVRTGLPPFLLIHGTEDQSVPYSQSVNFQAKLKGYGVTCELVTIEGAPHRITEWGKSGVDFKGQMVDWLIKTVGSKEQRLKHEKASGCESIEPIDAPFAMSDLKRPVFPNRVVDIRQYDAVADGRTDNTKAFSKAIDFCADAGGGRVRVPKGKWYTGPIHLKSNIELYLSEGAEIIFSDRFEDYLPVVLARVGGIELYNYSSLIYARDCENVAVIGPGKLNGNAEAWWPWKSRETKAFFEMAAAGVPVEKRVFGTPEAAIRPSFLCLVNCRNVLLEGFTIGSGPNWTVHPIYCENVIIRRINVLTDGPNNDGIDPDSCKNVLIEHCIFDTGDDCVVLKSGYNEDGWRVARPTENVVMRHCFSKRGHGGLVIGSEMSGDVRNVYMHDCTFEGTDRAVRIKSKRGRGGVVENVWVRNITLRNMQREAVIFNMAYTSDKNQAHNDKAPVFRNFDIRNLTCDGAPTAILMRALEDAPIESVHFENITISSKQGVVCENVKNVVFDTVSITPIKGPIYKITNGCDVTIRKNMLPEGTDVFLEAAGAVSSKICVLESDLSKASRPVLVKNGAVKEAVSVD